MIEINNLLIVPIFLCFNEYASFLKFRFVFF